MRSLLLLAILFWIAPTVYAQKKFIYSDASKIEEMGGSTSFFEDKSRLLTYNQVVAHADSLFKPNDKSFLNFQNNPNPIWVRIFIENRTAEELLLEFGNNELEQIDLYVKDENGIVKNMKSGNFTDYDSRFIKSSSVTLSLGKHPKEILIRNQTNTSFFYPIFCTTLKVIAERHHRADLFDGAFLGLIVTVLIYNLFIFFRLQEKVYLFYCIYILMQGLVVLRFKGLAFDVLWPNYPVLNNLPNFVPGMVGVSSIWFSFYFLNLKILTPRFIPFLRGLTACFITSMILDIFKIQPHANMVMQASIILNVFTFLSLSIYSAYKGFFPARYYLVAWIGLIFGAMTLTLALNNVVPYGSFFNISAFELSTAWQAIFLSLALADKIQLFVSEKNKLKELRTQAEMKALRSQMNPHFIFNCMNTIEAFVLDNKPREASGFLQKFSKLTRRVLEYSEHELVSLEKDIETLKLYIDLEVIRYNNVFEHKVIVDFDVHREAYLMPPLLIQPFVENAILHGLRFKTEGQGLLTIHYYKEDNQLICEVIDNGIGRAAAEAIKAKSSIKRNSMGMKVTNDRIRVIDASYEQGASVTLSDVDGGGTRVLVRVPLLKDI
jgi:two-component sensor histidine kinase